jgi:hypothetical protein
VPRPKITKLDPRAPVQRLLGTIVWQTSFGLGILPIYLSVAYFRHYLFTRSSFQAIISRFSAKDHVGVCHQVLSSRARFFLSAPAIKFGDRERAFSLHLFVYRSAH